MLFGFLKKLDDLDFKLKVWDPYYQSKGISSQIYPYVEFSFSILSFLWVCQLCGCKL